MLQTVFIAVDASSLESALWWWFTPHSNTSSPRQILHEFLLVATPNTLIQQSMDRYGGLEARQDRNELR